MDISLLGIGFAGGFLSFLTPCSLLGLLSFISHVTAEGYDLKRGFIASLLYGLGYILVFSSIGIGLLFVPGFIIKQVWLRLVGGIVVIVMGFILATDLINRIRKNQGNIDGQATGRAGRALNDETEEASSPNAKSNEKIGYMRSFIIGISLGTSGIACVLPIFLGVIGIIVSTSDMLGGFFAFSFYALGMVVPIFAIGAMIGKVNEVIIIKLVKITAKIRLLFGILLVIFGFLYIREALLILGVW